MQREQVLGALAALSHESRLEIFRLLIRLYPESVSAGHISTSLRIVPPTLSFHLSLLTRWDLITSAREGRWIYYRANLAKMREFLGYLMENCCVDESERSTGAALPQIAVTHSKKRAAATLR